jgi:hypothetical protein
MVTRGPREKICKETVVTYFKLLFQNFPGGTEEKDEKTWVRIAGLCCRYLNLNPPEYSARVLTTRPRRFVPSCRRPGFDSCYTHIFSLYHCVQTGTAAHPFFCPMRTGVSLPHIETDRVWNWPLTIQYGGQKWVDLRLHYPIRLYGLFTLCDVCDHLKFRNSWSQFVFVVNRGDSFTQWRDWLRTRRVGLDSRHGEGVFSCLCAPDWLLESMQPAINTMSIQRSYAKYRDWTVKLNT